MLEERARVLARKADTGNAAGVTLVLFVRGGVTYGIRPEEVDGAGRLKDFTPVPGAPPYLVGAVQFRSQVISLIDPAAFWGLEVSGVADLPLYLVLSAKAEERGAPARRLGLAIEELEGLGEVSSRLDPYQAEPRSGATHVGRRDDKVIIVVSAADLMRDARLTAVGAA
jgi:purine-binding chemotaxis protein CheW